MTTLLIALFLTCTDFDEIDGPPAACAVVDLVNTPADEDCANCAWESR